MFIFEYVMACFIVSIIILLILAYKDFNRKI